MFLFTLMALTAHAESSWKVTKSGFFLFSLLFVSILSETLQLDSVNKSLFARELRRVELVGNKYSEWVELGPAKIIIRPLSRELQTLQAYALLALEKLFVYFFLGFFSIITILEIETQTIFLFNTFYVWFMIVSSDELFNYQKVDGCLNYSSYH